MSDILAKMAAAHEKRQMVAVEVPEYGITLHFPALTLADRANIRKAAGKGDDVELMVCTLIRMARHADGTAVFPDNGESRQVLYGMEVSVLQRIMADADPGGANEGTAKNA